ncbi:hypothetical protein H632_c495p3 [Helicosporidium sp. ATCC 50920]|nr:hypothetical protein H632_c495p3 [Helicosporidium sp. ATCC 50920]|eukprot:KDD75797.1 hypothetical protein H632_c495p3 [Helicosporidium sp. ATCC 50920]
MSARARGEGGDVTGTGAGARITDSNNKILRWTKNTEAIPVIIAKMPTHNLAPRANLEYVFHATTHLNKPLPVPWRLGNVGRKGVMKSSFFDPAKQS